MRDGQILQEGISRLGTSYIDSSLQYSESYEPGAKFKYCLRYIPNLVKFSQFDFLNNKEFCQTLVIPWRGIIKGLVQVRPNGYVTAAGVDGINVCVWTKSNFDSKKPASLCTITNLDGSYSLEPSISSTQITQNLVVNAFLPGHIILTYDMAPPTTRVTSLDYRQETTVLFVDNSTVSIVGRVVISGSNCGISGVDVYKDGVKTGSTDSKGSFAISASIGANPKIKLVYPYDNGTASDHIFFPDQVPLPELFMDYEIQQAFEDITTREIEITNILGGLCKIPIATSEIIVSARDCQDSFPTFKLPPIDFRRTQTVKVPAHRLGLRVDFGKVSTFPGVNLGDVIEFMKSTTQDSQSYDMRFENSHFSLYYYVKPTIEAFKVPTSIPAQLSETCSLSKLGVDGVVKEKSNETIALRVYENYQRGLCFSSSGSLIVTDFVSVPLGDQPLQSEIPLDGSLFYTYFISETSPNIFDPYYKTLQLEAVIPYSLNNKDGVVQNLIGLKIVVLGSLALENTFTASTSRLPLMILRDPPGGSSYTELTQGKSFSVGISTTKDLSSGFGAEGDFGLGAGSEASIGFATGGLFAMVFGATSVKAKYILKGEGALEVSVGVTSETSLEFNVEASVTITTSQSIGLTGRQGDILTGLAQIFQYGRSRTLTIVSDPENGCKFETIENVIFAPLGSKDDTFFIYTHFYVESILIPNLETALEIAKLQSDDEAIQKQISQLTKDLDEWKSILEFKESKLKSKVPVNPYTSTNSTVKKLIDDLKSQSSNIFRTWSQHKDGLIVNDPKNIAFTSLIEVFASLAFSMNVVGVASLYELLTTYSLVLDDIRKESYMEDLETDINEMKNTIKNIESQLNAIQDYPLAAPRISFDGGIGGFQQTITTTRTQSTSFEFSLSLEGKSGLGKSKLELEAVGASSEGESAVVIKGAVEIGRTGSKSSSESNTVSFYLGDPNPLDSFVINVKEDPYYGVPIFEIVSATTSCPHEQGTDPVEMPILIPLGPTKAIGVPQDHYAEFTLQLRNLNSKTSTFGLQVDPLSLSGAQITINDAPLNSGPVSFSLDLNNPSDVIMKIYPGPEKFNYEGLGIELFSVCESDLSGDPSSGVFIIILVQLQILMLNLQRYVLKPIGMKTFYL